MARPTPVVHGPAAEPLAPTAGSGRVVRAVAALKWSLLRGGLRRGAQQRVQALLAFVFASGLGLVGMTVFTAISRGPQAGDEVIVVALPVVVAMVGLLAASAGVETALDVRNLAAEPLRPGQLGAGVLAAALVGPAALAGGISGIGLLLGWGTTRPGGAAVLVAVLAAWWATLLLVSRNAANLLGVLVTGRFRTVAQTLAAASALGLWFVFQFSAGAITGWDRPRWAAIAGVLAFTPPGQLGRALVAAPDHPAAAAGHLLLGGLWLPPLWVLHSVTTARLALAPIRDVPRPPRGRRSAGIRVGPWRWLPPGPAGAVAARTLRTKFRSPREAVNTVVAVLLGAGALVLAPVLTGSADGRLVLSAGLLHFAVLFEANNTYGFDGPALRAEVEAGADGRVLVRGKVLASLAVMAVPAVVLVVVLAAVLDGWRWAPAGLALASGSVLLATAASAVSAALAPFALPESSNPLAGGDTGQGCLAGTVLAGGMVVLGVVSAPLAVAVWWASTRSPAATAVVSLAAPLMGAAVLALAVRGASRLLFGREHELVAKVTPGR